MNLKLEESLRWGQDYIRTFNLTPILGGSCLLGLMAFNDLIDGDNEADFAVDGVEFEKMKEKIIADPHFKTQVKTKSKEGIFYLQYKEGFPLCSFGPFYIEGDYSYYNIIDNEYLIWKKEHYQKTQTKTYKDVTYVIPFDPIGYLEEYYGGQWDDFDARTNWHWKKAKNRVISDSYPPTYEKIIR